MTTWPHRRGRWILRSESQRESALAAIQGIDLGAKGVLEVVLRPHQRPRTLDQNAAYWRAVTELAEHCGYLKHEMHELLLAEHFGTKEVGRLVVPAKRSSELSVEEMRGYLDWLPPFAAQTFGAQVWIGREDRT